MVRHACAGLLAALIAASLPGAATAQPLDAEADPDRLKSRIETLARYGADENGGVSRLAYSSSDVAGRDYVIGLMRDLGMEVRIDAAGNIFGRRPGSNPDLAPILAGSHLDTVPNGGKYDGTAGVLTALEAVELLEAKEVTTRHPLEIVVFSGEEAGLIGAKAFAGILDVASLQETAQAGIEIGKGIAKIGGDPENIGRAAVEPGSYKAYIELHVEQGAVLDEADLDIGVVQGIVGIRWWDVTVTGEANHAGTTPMDQRRDALVTASKFVLVVERIIREAPGRQVGTVGRIEAFPGAPNVVPGRVETSLEIRDLEAERIARFFQEIRKKAQSIAETDGTEIAFRKSPIQEAPADTAPWLRDSIAESAERRGYGFKRMPSGAGHDAQAVAHVAPIGMIFVPSKDGISHAPEEFTSKEALAKGANVVLDTILAADRRQQ